MSRHRSLILSLLLLSIIVFGLLFSILETNTNTDLLPTLASLDGKISSPFGESLIANDAVSIVKEVDAGQEVIIQFVDPATAPQLDQILAELNAKWIQDAPLINGAVIMSSDLITTEIIENLASTVIIEPNYTVHSLQTFPTDDPLIDEQWALHSLDLESMWSSIDDSDIIVAVIDSGVCFNHPDLSGRFLANGFDFVENDDKPSDELGHGCAISGIIGANANNNIGITGIAPHVKILPLRVLDEKGSGTYANVISAIYYAVDAGADILNLSLGGQNHSQLLEQAVNYAIANGVDVVAGSGNTGTEGVFYPAKYPNVIAVGSHGMDGNRSSFSTYGNEVDRLAPGENILTTAMNGDYDYFTGTSMAVPYVTSLLALSKAAGEPEPVVLVDSLSTIPSDENSEVFALDTGTPASSTPVPTLTPTSTPPSNFSCSDLHISMEYIGGNVMQFYFMNSNDTATELSSIDWEFTGSTLYVNQIFFMVPYAYSFVYEIWNGDQNSTSPLYIDSTIPTADGQYLWSESNVTIPANSTRQIQANFLAESGSSNLQTVSFDGTIFSLVHPSSPTPCDLRVPDDLESFLPTPQPTPTAGYLRDEPPFPECGNTDIIFYSVFQNSVLYKLEDVDIPTDYLVDMSYAYYSPLAPASATNTLSNITFDFYETIWVGDPESDSIDEGSWYSSPYLDFTYIIINHNTDFDMSQYYLPTDFNTAFHVYSDIEGGYCTIYPIIPDIGATPTPSPTIYSTVTSTGSTLTPNPTNTPTLIPTPTATPMSCENYSDNYTLGTVQTHFEPDLQRAIECANQSLADNIIDLNGQSLTFDYAPNTYDYFGYNALAPIVPLASGGRLTIQNGKIERNVGTIPCEPSMIDRSLFRLLITQTNSHLTLSDVTIKNGCALDYVANDGKNGGGIYNEGTLILNNSLITLNKAIRVGGGIYNADYSTITVTGSTFTHNAGISGGGIFSDRDNQVTINDSTFSYNSAYGDCNCGGGGISIYYGGDVSITNSIFTNNFADGFGGGIENDGSTLTLVDSIVSDNTSFASGGGIYQYGYFTSSILRTTIDNNYASDYGGGIFQQGGKLNITDSVISNNNAPAGAGGIDVRDDMIITGSTISGNTTDSYGAGIRSAYGSNPLTLSNSTVYGNSSLYRGGGFSLTGSSLTTLQNTTVANNSAVQDGGGMFVDNGAVMTLANSIIADSPSGGDCWGTLSFTGMNLIEDDSCAASTNGQLTGDPKLDLVGLQLTTGSVPTVPLLSDSPAIDVGDDTEASGLTYDQRGLGYPRIFGTQVDLGAYEYQPIIVTNTPSPMPASTLTPYPTATATATVPSLTPSVTYTPSTTYTPSVTFTPSATFTPSLTLSPTMTPTATYTLTPSATPISCEVYAGVYILGTVQSDLVKDLQKAVECANQSLDDNTIDLNGQTVVFDSAPAIYDLDGYNALQSIQTATTAGILRIQNGTLERNIALNTCDTTKTLRTQFRLLHLSDGADVSLSNVVIRNGCAGNNTNYILARFAGGILNNGDLSIVNSLITSNRAYSGGGIGNINDGTIIITDSVIENNNVNTAGGGLSNANNGEVTITNSTIKNNSGGTYGGGLTNTNNGKLTIRSSILQGNTNGNSAGGIYSNTQTTGDLTIIDSTLYDNRSNYDGGAIALHSDAPLTIINSTIYNNSAKNGGGIILASSSSATITNTTITQNSASTRGGGLYENTSGIVTLINSILASNVDTYNGDCYGYITFVGMNLIADDTCNASTNGQLTGNPKLDASGLQLNTGSVPTIALLSDSPAIDVGDNSQVTGISYDQRGIGYPRIHGAQVDLGAYEYQPIIVTNTPSPTATYTLTPSNTPTVPTATYTFTSTYTATPLPTVTPQPIQPTGFTTTTVTDSSIGLSWLDPSAFELEYRLMRSTNNVNWSQLAILPANSVSYLDATVSCEQSYWYRLVAVYSVDSSPAELSIMTPKCQVVIPESVSTTLAANKTTLTWQPISTRKTSELIIERAEQANDAIVSLSEDWSVIARLPGDFSIFTDEDLRCGMTYTYRMTGYNQTYNEYTETGNFVQITSLDCPLPVTNTIGIYYEGRWAFRDGFENDAAVTSFRFGPQEAGWIPLTGDWDGDGVDGIGIYKDGIFALRDIAEQGSKDYVYRFGSQQAGWQPIVGDWDGDGSDTVGLYREGRFMLTNSHTSSTIDYQFVFGNRESGWQAIAGDWNNYGRDYVGMYKNGIFYLANNFKNNATPQIIRFGTGDDWTSIAGDWNSDGITTLGLYKDNNWRLSNTLNGTMDIGIRFSQFNGQGYPLASYRGGEEALEALAMFAMSNELNVNISQAPTSTPTLEPTIVSVATRETELEITSTITSTSESVDITPTVPSEITPPIPEPTAQAILTPTIPASSTPIPATATIMPTVQASFTPTIQASSTSIPVTVTSLPSLEPIQAEE